MMRAKRTIEVAMVTTNRYLGWSVQIILGSKSYGEGCREPPKPTYWPQSRSKHTPGAHFDSRWPWFWEQQWNQHQPKVSVFLGENDEFHKSDQTWSTKAVTKTCHWQYRHVWAPCHRNAIARYYLVSDRGAQQRQFKAFQVEVNTRGSSTNGYFYAGKTMIYENRWKIDHKISCRVQEQRHTTHIAKFWRLQRVTGDKKPTLCTRL